MYPNLAFISIEFPGNEICEDFTKQAKTNERMPHWFLRARSYTCFVSSGFMDNSQKIQFLMCYHLDLAISQNNARNGRLSVMLVPVPLNLCA